LVGFSYIASFAVLVAAGCGGAGSNAETECVDNVCPCSEGGLRAAISEAGIRAAITEGLGPYTFDCDGPTTIITGREIVIDIDVTLDGGGNLTVDGNRTHRVFSVLDSVTAELIGFTVTNGRESEQDGGGIRNEGTLTLRNATVSESSAGRETGCRTTDPNLLCSEGGGIWNAGTLTLMDSTVSGNTAPFGGGISNRDGSLTVIDSVIRMNSADGCRVGDAFCSFGGGVWNSGMLTVENSTVSGNASDWGGGIFNRGVREPTIRNSTISGNSAGSDGGGLLNFATLTLVGSTVADNVAGQSGGGVANQRPGTLEVTTSTLSGNTAAAAGGGLFNPAGAAAELLNTTVSTNTAEREGGGIYTGGELVLISSTIARNDALIRASAIYDDPDSPSARVRSIANTLIEGDCADSPPFDSDGYNIESPGDTCGFNDATDRPAEDQLNLGPLQNNDGPTLTHALLENSAAIDQIPAADCVDGAGDLLTADQRGKPRPAGVSSSCDVGAFEVQPEVQP
jgi:predicted outer membrane repeat protein